MNASRNHLPLEFAEAAKNRSRLAEAEAAANKRLRATENVDESKKRSRLLDALSAMGVFLLGILLPRSYKIFAPFLFVIPAIIAAVNKARLSNVKYRDPMQDQAHSAPMPGRIPSLDPYAEIPKDPKDPRRYKPIG